MSGCRSTYRGHTFFLEKIELTFLCVLSCHTELRITKDTELGDNDTIKQGRKSQLADLAASKGILRCGGGTTASTSNNAAPSATPSTRRAFSSSSASGAASSSRQPLPLPHPTPRFPSITYLADGSSIAMTTTSPRSVSRLTKDTTNHPLWNPKMLERGLGAASSEGDSGEEQGRMERFRRRFGGAGKGNFAAAGSQAPGRAPAAEEKQWGAEALQSKRSAPSSSRKGATPSGPSATPQTQQQPASQPRKRASMFDVDDLDWMSGGRQARAGSPLRKETGKKK